MSTDDGSISSTKKRKRSLSGKVHQSGLSRGKNYRYLYIYSECSKWNTYKYLNSRGKHRKQNITVSSSTGYRHKHTKNRKCDDDRCRCMIILFGASKTTSNHTNIRYHRSDRSRIFQGCKKTS